MLYRGMDRTQLDGAYNNTAAVLERGAIVADWAARSATMRREHAGHLDLAYGDSLRERLDLFLAANPRAPTLAFIHGGYWQMNDKENFAFFAEGLLPLGINLAVVEYTLAPAARLDRIVAEVRRAVQWLAEHLDDYGADPTRLYVSGHSAGGHLTAMTMPCPCGPRWARDQRDLRSRADPAQLSQRETGSRHRRGRAQQPAPAFAKDGKGACCRLWH